MSSDSRRSQKVPLNGFKKKNPLMVIICLFHGWFLSMVKVPFPILETTIGFLIFFSCVNRPVQTTWAVLLSTNYTGGGTARFKYHAQVQKLFKSWIYDLNQEHSFMFYTRLLCFQLVSLMFLCDAGNAACWCPKVFYSSSSSKTRSLTLVLFMKNTTRE